MNKLMVFTALLMSQFLPIQASEQKEEYCRTYIYSSDSINPTQIIKTDCKTGLKEIILVLPGENREEKTTELMMFEVMAWMKSKQDRNASGK